MDFVEATQGCVSDVYFISREGDYLNLKSMLSLYLFAVACGDRVLLERGYIECKDVSDYGRLSAYLCDDEAT